MCQPSSSLPDCGGCCLLVAMTKSSALFEGVIPLLTNKKYLEGAFAEVSLGNVRPEEEAYKMKSTFVCGVRRERRRQRFSATEKWWVVTPFLPNNSELLTLAQRNDGETKTKRERR